ncbi:hypothetical protein C8Q73DRAFT_793544 [Cubamyces lactineus]|nr:hypothetical protein C8Q73DRAFT_793544 [Cubamyces lactineus]
MMFTRLAALTLGAMPILAAATPLEGRTDGDSCSTGTLQCCNSVTPANSASGSVPPATLPEAAGTGPGASVPHLRPHAALHDDAGEAVHADEASRTLTAIT